MFSGRISSLWVMVVVMFVAGAARAELGGEMRHFFWKADSLAAFKAQYDSGDPAIQAAADEVFRMADSANWRARNGLFYSVIDGGYVVPGATPNRYTTTAAYGWPNPNTDDGLPWIIRDGYINPDGKEDSTAMLSNARFAANSALAYYLTGDEKYAETASGFIRHFYLNPETRVLPEIKYSLILPGYGTGAYGGPGLHRYFDQLFDAAGILEASEHWTADDKAGLQQWALDHVTFMETDSLPLAHARTLDNHRTAYEVIATLLSLYAGDEDRARAHLESYRDNVVDIQFNADGTQHYPLLRADSRLYHEYNLRGAIDLVQLADFFDDIDLRNWVAEDGASIRNSVEFLVPYFTGELEWEFWPGEPFAPQEHSWYNLFQEAAVAFDSPELAEAAQRVAGDHAKRMSNVVFPTSAITPEPLLLGDANGDGQVDGNDLIAVEDFFGDTGEPGIPEDANGDGQVDGNDLIAVEEHFGQTMPSAAVPEPGTLALLGICGLIAIRRRR